MPAAGLFSWGIYSIKQNPIGAIPDLSENQASEKNHTSTVNDNASIADQSNMVLMGTTVAKGQAKGLVIGTGMQTELGRIAGKSQQIKQDISPLQKQINLLAKKTTFITLLLGAALFVFGMVQGEKIPVSLVLAISIAAAMVPEGLPAQISIALALGVRRLAKKQAVVKQLSSVEALGSATSLALAACVIYLTGFELIKMKKMKNEISIKNEQ